MYELLGMSLGCWTAKKSCLDVDRNQICRDTTHGDSVNRNLNDTSVDAFIGSAAATKMILTKMMTNDVYVSSFVVTLNGIERGVIKSARECTETQGNPIERF